MTFRGYSAQIEYSAEDQCLIDPIAGIEDIGPQPDGQLFPGRPDPLII
jgi:hypothetical protein